MQGVLGAARDGAFAEFVVLPERNLVAVPDGLDLAVAGVVSDAVATPFHAAHARARLVPGERVAVIGAGGGVGVHMVGMAQAFGALVVAVERAPAKLARLAELGGLEAIVPATAGARRRRSSSSAPVDRSTPCSTPSVRRRRCAWVSRRWAAAGGSW